MGQFFERKYVSVVSLKGERKKQTIIYKPCNEN